MKELLVEVLGLFAEVEPFSPLFFLSSSSRPALYRSLALRQHFFLGVHAYSPCSSSPHVHLASSDARLLFLLLARPGGGERVGASLQLWPEDSQVGDGESLFPRFSAPISSLCLSFSPSLSAARALLSVLFI